MGQKVHPHGFRLGVIYPWESRWFAEKDGYTERVRLDHELREHISGKDGRGGLLPDAGISRVEIDRNANMVTVTVHTAKPGIVIGRGGARVEELRGSLEELTGGRVRVNIQEIRTPEMDAYLLARSVADQLERRVAFRRAVKQAVQRTMQRGAKGVRITVAGRLGGTEMSRRETETAGRVPRHTLRADIDYGLAEAHTTYGRIGVKAWVYKGDILPDEAEEEIEEPIEAAQPPDGVADDGDAAAEVAAPVADAARGPQRTAISVEQQETVARQSQEGD